MDASALVGRVKVRYLDGEHVPDDPVIEEMLATVIDRLALKVGTSELPGEAGSIAVDAAVKALRLRGFEGSTSESAADGGSMSSSFVDDVLAAYSDDIAQMKKAASRPGVKFFR